jgi:hypothetical protein
VNAPYYRIPRSNWARQHLTPLPPRLPERGRWIVVYWIGDVRISALARGIRIRSLSRARRLARQLNGVVRRFHADRWKKR